MEKYGDINNLLSEIKSQTKDENNQIIRQADDYCAGKLKQSERECVIRKRRIIEDAEKKGEAIKQRILSNLRLEVNRIKLIRQEEIMEKVFEIINIELEDIRKSKRYINLIRSFLKEAIGILDEKKIKLIFDKCDEKIINDKVIKELIEDCKKYHTELNRDSVVFKNDTGCGLIVEVNDKKLIYNNTLEAKLNRMKKDMEYDIYKELFENVNI